MVRGGDWAGRGLQASSPFGSSGLAVERGRDKGRGRNLLAVARWTPSSLWGERWGGQGSKHLPRRSSCKAVERGRGEGRGGIC
ncbi:hypothetical protein MRB53_018703 [Persea americana]|uniref:Uncharacterized protein n=1 Tax=Persea americana TaxID=3435 RepID=A0ACC2M8I1_PERAE|nr:hypothetical protein MRB53_018703 [Persea americana]